VTAPDRLVRNYIHPVLLFDELAALGCHTVRKGFTSRSKHPAPVTLG
jgi:hypothetical protein